MGAGARKGGDLWAGHELPADAVVLVPLTAAPAYDSWARTIPYDADGRAQQVHWVDQTVAVRLSVSKGKIAAAPEVGLDWAQLKLATTDNLDVVADDVVRQALKDLLDRRAVLLVRILAERDGARGRIRLDVTYTNRLLPNPRPRTVTTGI